MKAFMNNELMEEDGGGDVPPGSGGDAPPVTDDGNWYDGLPQDMREDQNITKFESVETMAKSWLNAQRLIGADKIPMPQTDDDWGSVFNKLGRPEEASGYEIKAPEGVEVNPDMQQAFLAKAHEIGLLPQQVQALADWQIQQGQEGTDATNQASESALNEKITALKSEWGQAFDQNAGIAQRAITEFATDADKDFMNNAVIDGVKVGDHPAMARLFHNIGKSMMESGKLEGKGVEGVMTPTEMQDKIDVLMGNPAYTDRKHPEHKQIGRQVQQLFEQKFS